MLIWNVNIKTYRKEKGLDFKLKSYTTTQGKTGRFNTFLNYVA
jgi:hypothetical protein